MESGLNGSSAGIQVHPSTPPPPPIPWPTRAPQPVELEPSQSEPMEAASVEAESVEPLPPGAADQEPPWPDQEPPSLTNDPRFQKLLRTFGGRIRKVVWDAPKTLAPEASGEEALQSDESSDE